MARAALKPLVVRLGFGNSHFLLLLLAHPTFRRVLVVCIAPAINRPASGLVEDQGQPWPVFPSQSRLRVREATVAHFALARSDFVCLIFRLNALANARPRQRPPSRKPRPRPRSFSHRPSPPSSAPLPPSRVLVKSRTRPRIFHLPFQSYSELTRRVTTYVTPSLVINIWTRVGQALI
jgi:hypothetical protein